MRACIAILLAGTWSLLPQARAWAVDQVVVVGLFKDKAILSIDGKQRVLAAGETSPEGVKLISANSREAVIEIDGNPATYELGTHISNEFKAAPTQATVRVLPDDTGTYRIGGQINGFAVDFIVDTGATLITLNRQHAKRIGIDYKLKGRESLSQTASGIVKNYVVTLDRVRVGEIELRGVEAAVHDDDFPKEALLGNSFLGRVQMKREGSVLELYRR